MIKQRRLVNTVTALGPLSSLEVLELVLVHWRSRRCVFLASSDAL